MVGDLPVGADPAGPPLRRPAGAYRPRGSSHDNDVVTEIGVRYRSARSAEDNDMQLCLATLFDPEQMRGFMPDPVAMFMVGAILMRPRSDRAPDHHDDRSRARHPTSSSTTSTTPPTWPA